MYPNLIDQTQFRLNKINEIKDYFIVKIRETETMSKRLNKYIADFGFFGKTVIILFATKGGTSIVFFASVINAPIGIASASFSFAFPITLWIIKTVKKYRVIRKGIIR